jgi:hypothetical protein
MLVAGRVCGSVVLSSLHGPLSRVATDGMWKGRAVLARRKVSLIAKAAVGEVAQLGNEIW